MAWPPRRVLVQETEYAITDLGTLGGPTSTASDINDKGQVCGTSHLVNGASHAFLWQGRLMKKIAAEGFEGSIASRIDRFGRVVGDLKRGSMTLGFIFDPKYPSRLTAIQPLAPFRDVHARGINEKGQVVGWGRDEQGRVRALLWNTIGKPPIDLGTFGGPNSAAYGINSFGWITGYARLQTRKDHAFFRKTGKLMDLGPPSDQRIASRFPFSYGYAINSSGQIAGYVASVPFTTGTTQAFLFTDHFIILSNSLGGTNSIALALNDRGEVVGRAETSIRRLHHAFLFRQGAMIDLNTRIPPNSGWELTVAWGINNRGQSVGTGTRGGYEHAFLLTPVTAKAPRP